MKVCSLFGERGGIDFVFYQAEVDIVWANDLDKYVVKEFDYIGVF